MISLMEFWPQFVGDRMAKSTDPLRLLNRILEVSVTTLQRRLLPRDMMRPLMPRSMSAGAGLWFGFSICRWMIPGRESVPLEVVGNKNAPLSELLGDTKVGNGMPDARLVF